MTDIEVIEQTVTEAFDLCSEPVKVGREILLRMKNGCDDTMMRDILISRISVIVAQFKCAESLKRLDDLTDKEES